MIRFIRDLRTIHSLVAATTITLLGCDQTTTSARPPISALTPAPQFEQPAIIKYVVPAQSFPAGQTSAPKWGLAAPMVDGFSDPNEIVYDDAYVQTYVDWAINSAISCGPCTYSITTPEGVVEVHSGQDESYLGRRFQVERLMRFLESRIGAEQVEREFRFDDPETAKKVRDHLNRGNRRLTYSPWDRDTDYVMSLLSNARYKPAYLLVTALLRDPSLSVRTSAVFALGRLAAVEPESVTHLVRLLPDTELGSVAADGLTMAGSVAVPALIEGMNHIDGTVRNRSVGALARMDACDAAPGLLAALNHGDPEVRECALSVSLDMQQRGASIATDDYRCPRHSAGGR